MQGNINVKRLIFTPKCLFWNVNLTAFIVSFILPLILILPLVAWVYYAYLGLAFIICVLSGMFVFFKVRRLC
jgi:hypothetical protein